MRTFEERYQAWIENRLSSAETEAFERELDALPAPAEEGEDADKLGALLCRHAVPPRLTNGDFFNHQLMARIAADERSAASRSTARLERWEWPWAHLAWGSVCALLLGWTLSRAPVTPSGLPPSPQLVGADTGVVRGAGGGSAGGQAGPSAYHAEVLDVRAFDPNVSATALHLEKEDVTVVWLDGLDYLPDDYQLQ